MPLTPTHEPEHLVVAPPCAVCGGLVRTVALPWGGEVKPRYCPTCADKIEQQEAAQERERLVARLLDRAGGGRMSGWSLETYPDDERGRKAKAQAACWFEAWIGGARANLLIFGQVGTGKSGLAWSLVRAACEQEHDALFLNFRDYLWDLRQSFSDPSWQVDRRAHWAGLLALDDVGAERPTDFAREELASLVEHRLAKKLATVVTSNYSPADLANRLGHDDPVVGQRIVSRLVEGAEQMRIDGGDLRLAQ